MTFPIARAHRAQGRSPFERRAADIWDKSVCPMFEAALAAYPDYHTAVLKHTRINFEHEIVRAFEDLSRLVIVETFDRPRVGGGDGKD
jgi:hypothetical protein